MWKWFEQWVLFVVAARTEVVVALDWTEFDRVQIQYGHRLIVTVHYARTRSMTGKREETLAEREWHELEAELLGRPRDNATKKKNIGTQGSSTPRTRLKEVIPKEAQA